jgi:hypothetical protein
MSETHCTVAEMRLIEPKILCTRPKHVAQMRRRFARLPRCFAQGQKWIAPLRESKIQGENTMTADERIYYETFLQMKQFGVESLPDFTPDSIGNREFTKLNLVISDAECESKQSKLG